jgi:endoglucanase
MTRREFLLAAAAISLMDAGLSKDDADAVATGTPTNTLPRWRGFNLLAMFDGQHAHEFKESDFEIIADWGFDFVRLPLSYLCWSSHADWMQVDEKALERIDRAIALGRAHKVHVNLNLHRLPGYCVNPPKEPASLWTDSAALDAAVHHWTVLAKRYKDVPASALSFDLINEPADLQVDLYVKVVTALVNAIREPSPDRLIIADGLKWGRAAVPELAGLKIGQSTRGYMPLQISHFKANWMPGSNTWAVPTWPLKLEKETWDRNRLIVEQKSFVDLQATGVGVHVGEWGAFNKTPHDVALAWMTDCLDLWKANNWGWALWNLTGSFGVMDSDRPDVKYESYKGHQLDRAMLDVLRAG